LKRKPTKSHSRHFLRPLSGSSSDSSSSHQNPIHLKRFPSFTFIPRLVPRPHLPLFSFDNFRSLSSFHLLSSSIRHVMPHWLEMNANAFACTRLISLALRSESTCLKFKRTVNVHLLPKPKLVSRVWLCVRLLALNNHNRNHRQVDDRCRALSARIGRKGIVTMNLTENVFPVDSTANKVPTIDNERIFACFVC
jgi:hypothetical protein